MFNYKMTIQEFSFKEDILDISVRIKCDYDVLVRSPKITVVFSNGRETRRLPFPLQAYFPESDLKSCVIFAHYNYEFNHLFKSFDKDDQITMQFEFRYGTIDCLIDKFELSSDLKLNDPFYFLDFKADDGYISLKKRKNNSKDHDKNIVLLAIKWVFYIIHHIILFAIAIVLTPWFLIESLLLAAGVIHGYQTDRLNTPKKFRMFLHIKTSYEFLFKQRFDRAQLRKISNVVYKLFCLKKVKKNRVTFISARRSDMTGNPEFVYNELKKNPDLEFKFLLNKDKFSHTKITHILRFLYLYATSAVVLVDDFYLLLSYADKRPEVKLIQLWHACGAFKTFGFSRLEKVGSPVQSSTNHRQYDYTTVSSKEIAKFYAEGFGLSDECVKATGVPRTDIFLDDEYKEKIRTNFFEEYPNLKGKKIVLFAPTFRGNGATDGNYPIERFDYKKIHKNLGDEYAILIKLHPFCHERYKIDKEYENCVIDFSDKSELNDLLFVTDLLITDYSSAIFEASLLNIPMLFYSYDLREYISSRDFYYEYHTFVPGKIVLTEENLIKALKESDFEKDKIEPFKQRFFDSLDGKSSERVANLVLSLLEK